ncbi:hypothetical protein ACEWN4_001024 [Serratia marcescens]|nr:hypothetical protein [Serratia marcescens]
MFKVTRTFPAPESLANKKDYKGSDVLNMLKECFHEKCYLCETKEPHDINVEHFIPHGEDEELKFKWNNLYLVCSRCNNIKLASKKELLDCCNEDIDVSTLISILPPTTPYAKKIPITALNDDQKVVNTTDLLERIYNSEHSINKEVTGSFLRRKIFDEMRKISDHMNKYLETDALQEEKDIALRKIKKLTEADAPYSAVAKHQVLNDTLFSKLIFEE